MEQEARDYWYKKGLRGKELEQQVEKSCCYTDDKKRIAKREKIEVKMRNSAKNTTPSVHARSVR